ncbi:right-handed parallel beta-helix repeat-containing protein, partial [Patescibacteria group bacterium]|nr:right-handed parallel beta-helix repeat-containing protein [Patescibacteria group bacterium]
VFTLRGSYVASVNQSNAAGSAVIIGGTLLACAGAIGSVTWRTGTNRYEVIPGMRVTHALANDRLIVVHPGTYTLTAQLLVNVARVTIRGSGRNTIFTTTVADLDIIQVTGVDVTFEDFVVDGNLGGAVNDIGIMVTACNGFTAINVTSRDNAEHGFYLDRVNYAKLIGCDAISNTLDGIHLLSTAAGNSTYNKIVNCTCSSNGSDGIEINQAAGGTVDDTIVSLNHLISNGVLPLNDGGTNTVDAHNVKV